MKPKSLKEEAYRLFKIVNGKPVDDSIYEFDHHENLEDWLTLARHVRARENRAYHAGVCKGHDDLTPYSSPN